jgi:Flp pilus assembly protein CpaB
VRRAASAVLLGVAVLIAGRAVLDRVDPATEPVLVATHDLAVGATLTAGDVRVVQRPRGARPATPPVPSTAAVGAVLATPLTAGEEITTGRFVGPALLRGQPAGSRALWLPAVGPDALTGISPGTRVDVHAPGAATPVLRGAVVLARTGSGGGSAAGLLGSAVEQAAGVLVAAPGADAARVLGADLGEVGAFRFALAGG